MMLDTVERGPAVLLALPFRFRYEINFARELYPAGAGKVCSWCHTPTLVKPPPLTRRASKPRQPAVQIADDGLIHRPGHTVCSGVGQLGQLR
jgi:hypothetical protein